MPKMILGGVAAVLIALLAGFLWGASGKSTMDRALEDAELRNDLFAAQGAVLNARIDVYNTNFGDASRHLEEARAHVGGAMERLQRLERDADLKQLESSLAPIQQAQQLAGKLDLAANARAADAATIIEGALQTAAKR